MLWRIVGNSCADEFGSQAAAEVLCKATAKPEVSWVDAVAHLVRRRAVRANLDCMALDPIQSKKVPKGPSMCKQAILTASSTHHLERVGPRWYCRECE